MGTLLAILGIMNSVKTMQSDKFKGSLGLLGTVNQAGWFNNSPESNPNALGDFGVRRNFL